MTFPDFHRHFGWTASQYWAYVQTMNALMVRYRKMNPSMKGEMR